MTLDQRLNATHADVFQRDERKIAGNHYAFEMKPLYEAAKDGGLGLDVLKALASTMADDRNDDNGLDRTKSTLAAGYTYLGQFIDHDLTHDRTKFSATQRGIGGSSDRTPAFDLDSLYGRGPDDDPDLFSDNARLKLGDGEKDLYRKTGGESCIGDKRNDSNLVVAQIHLAFARFHNRAVNQFGGDFKEARRRTTWHYQWIVLHDFLPKIVGAPLATAVLDDAYSPLFYKRESWGRIPAEFSGAAFRFGHSMIRRGYRLNDQSGAIVTFITSDPGSNTTDDLRGFRALTDRTRIDWHHFFPFADGLDNRVQLAAPINTCLNKALSTLPFVASGDTMPEGRSLPFRNLVRGEQMLGLESGQFIAKRLGLPDNQILGLGHDIAYRMGNWNDVGNVGGSGLKRAEVERAVSARTPLWYYILAEAWQSKELGGQGEPGEQLGPVGGRIVAEVIAGLMRADQEKKSWLSADSGWKPKAGEFGCSVDGQYPMSDFLRYAAEA